VHPELVGPAGEGVQPVQAETVAVVQQLDAGPCVRLTRHLPCLEGSALLDDPRHHLGRHPARWQRGDGEVGLAHPPRGEQLLVGGAPLPPGREQEHPGGEPVEPVGRRQLGQAELASQPEHDGLRDVPPPGHGRQEVRLVDHDDVVVPVQDDELTGHGRLLGQVAVQPDRAAGAVGRGRVHHGAVVEENLAGGQAVVDRLRLTRDVTQERRDRRPATLHRHPHPGRGDAVPVGQRRKAPPTGHACPGPRVSRG